MNPYDHFKIYETKMGFKSSTTGKMTVWEKTFTKKRYEKGTFVHYKGLLLQVISSEPQTISYKTVYDMFDLEDLEVMGMEL